MKLEQFKALLIKSRQGDEEAKTKIVNENIPLVWSLVHRFKNTLYDNFLRELNDEKDNGANVYTANSFRDEFADGVKVLDEENEISLQILNSKFYATDESGDAHSENDYSVCTLISHGEKDFLFNWCCNSKRFNFR